MHHNNKNRGRNMLKYINGAKYRKDNIFITIINDMLIQHNKQIIMSTRSHMQVYMQVYPLLDFI